MKDSLCLMVLDMYERHAVCTVWLRDAGGGWHQSHECDVMRDDSGEWDRAAVLDVFSGKLGTRSKAGAGGVPALVVLSGVGSAELLGQLEKRKKWRNRVESNGCQVVAWEDFQGDPHDSAKELFDEMDVS